MRDFDGTGNEYITHVLNNLTLNQVSIFYHFNIDSNSQYKRFFEININTSNVFRMEFDDGWGFVFKAIWSSSDGAWSISKPSTGSDHNLLITYDAGSTANDPSYAIDGGSLTTMLERNGPSGTITTTGINKLTLGANSGGGAGGAGAWNGRGGEFATWNRVLSQAEYNALNLGFSPLFFMRGLKTYIPLRGNYSTEVDYMGGATGTVTGTPVKSTHPDIIMPTADQIMRFGSGAVAPQTARNHLTLLGVS